MNRRMFAGAVIALSLTASPAFSQSEESAGKPKSPDWFLGGSAPDPGGRLSVGPGGRVAADAGGRAGGRGGPGRGGPMAACADDTAKLCPGQTGFGARGCLTENSDKLSAQCKTALAAIPAAGTMGCSRSPVCDSRHGGTRRDLQ